MKRILTLILTALCLAAVPLSAQEYRSTPVTVSQEKVSKDGKVYFAHKVLDRQTLFSISRAYGVSYQDIVDANPESDLSRGQIQAGQILLIPEKEIPVETAAAAPAVQEMQQTASGPSGGRKQKVRFIISREFVGHQTMEDAFSHLIERRTEDHYQRWREEQEAALQSGQETLLKAG